MEPEKFLKSSIPNNGSVEIKADQSSKRQLLLFSALGHPRNFSE